MSEKNKVISISDFFKKNVTNKTLKSIDEAFDNYETFSKSHESRSLDVLEPAFSKMYDVFTESIKSWKGVTDETELGDKHIKDYKNAVTKSLKKLFGNIEPAILKSLEGVAEKDHYDILVHHYDLMIGADNNKNVRGLEGLEMLIGKGKFKVKDLRQLFLSYKQQGHEFVHQTELNRYLSSKITAYKTHELGQYFSKKVKDAGYEIKDDVEFHNQDHSKFIQLNNALRKGDWGKEGYKGFHLKKSKENKKDYVPKAA